MNLFLLFSVFIVSTCGLVFELISSTLASYLLGDTVTHFSIIIGIYLCAMGVGSYLSSFFHRNLILKFVQIELLIGLFGGFSAAVLLVAFEYVSYFHALLLSWVSLIGILVGVEIPLIMRILKTHFEFKDLVAKVFTLDYIGALLAALAFPLLLIPYLGILRTCFLFGLLNLFVAIGTLKYLKPWNSGIYATISTAFVFALFLCLGLTQSERITSFADASAFSDPVIISKQTRYQHLTITKSNHALKLYINRNIQFSTYDEYRYHESLVHIGAAASQPLEHVLILGGGDGLAVRELLKYPSIKTITLVDLDQELTELFSNNPTLVDINSNSLNSPKVKIYHEDAFVWLRKNRRVFDFIVMDFPDPSNFSLGKLYSLKFFRELKRALRPGAMSAIQSTSPYFARKSFWCIHHTLRHAGFNTKPYHVYIPSFGEWGFVIASTGDFILPKSLPSNLKFLDMAVLPSLFHFPSDMAWLETKLNRLNNQALVKYFDKEWSVFIR